MKFQLVIASVLLLSAFALPVPDEEVSPVLAAVVPEIKIDGVAKPEEKPVEAIIPQLRAAAEEKSAEANIPELRAAEEQPAAKKAEEPKAELPLNAPDAELLQPLDAKKEDKLADKLSEKQIRADNQEVKALPIGEAPVVPVQKQNTVGEEIKSTVQEVVAEGKSAALAETPASEQKKEELIVAESAPAIKSEKLATLVESVAPLSEEKKDEALPARQERVNEKSDGLVHTHEAVVPAAGADEVVPVFKSLTPESEAAIKPEQPAEAAKIQDAAIAAPELKLAEAEKTEKYTAEAQQAAGDIPQSAEASGIKLLDSELKQKTTEPIAAAVAAPAAAAATPEGKGIEEPAAAKPTEEAKQENTEHLHKTKEIPAKEEKQSAESSEESKESDESKENKSN